MRIVVVVPFLDEARFLPRFLASVADQTRPPDRLLLVDDGSTDDSFRIAAEFAARHSYATAWRRPPRPAQPDRLATADELRAFVWAVQRIEDAWDVVAKLDGDLQLTPETIAFVERQLELDPQLGLAGSYLSEMDPSGTRARLQIRPEHVHGATKFYRRDCYEQLEPLPAILGWDTIDEVKARLLGWRTESFALPGGDPLHLRRRASQDGVARGYRRSGRGAYILGQHPLHVLLFGIRYLRESPGLTGCINYLAGWGSAALRRTTRAEPQVRSHIRRNQLRRIRRRLRRMGRELRPFPTTP